MVLDDEYLDIAAGASRGSTCLHRKYGAVLVNHNQILAIGCNGAPPGEKSCKECGICYQDSNDRPRDSGARMHAGQYGRCVAVHAEQSVILHADRAELKGSTLYLATEDDSFPVPCNICDRLIREAGIARVVTRSEVIKIERKITK